MKKRILTLVTILVLMLLSCVYGILIYRNQFFPYAIAKSLYSTAKSLFYIGTGSSIDPDYLKTDVEGLILIEEPNDIDEMRTRLITFLWGTTGLPTNELPSEIEGDFKDERYADLFTSSLQKIDRIVVDMEFGLKSYIYHFMPKNNDNNKIVLFHQGHKGDFILNKELIGELLDQGYSVAAFCMPLLGLNNRPIVYLPRFGYLKLRFHNHIRFLNPEHGNSLKYFVQPIVVFLNYANKNFNYEHVAMIGISGGGWTTTLAAAVDTRIQSSFPVAGTEPMYIRSIGGNTGDWEQIDPELLRISNYLEMYILGAYGGNRRQLQILNKFDPCCFAGVKWQTYKPTIRKRVEMLGKGSWDLFMDDSHTSHIISPVSRVEIFSTLKKAK